MVSFEWDEKKNAENQRKHGVSFEEAKAAFFDPCRVIMEDVKHSAKELRLFCYGEVGGKIVTVRFTLRKNTIRIIGAAYWRDGKKIYGKARTNKNTKPKTH